jgi:hypothetical protein
MSLPENDVVRLQHMLDAGEQALAFCAGKSRADLDGDVMLRTNSQPRCWWPMRARASSPRSSSR